MASTPTKTISLSLTATYAPSWGVWQGVRELVQNMHDGAYKSAEAIAPAGDRPIVVFQKGDGQTWTAFGNGGAVVGSVSYTPGRLEIRNASTSISRKALLLGFSSKSSATEVIGAFGEGLKVGALALLRCGCELEMHTGDSLWVFECLMSEDFGEKVLTVSVYPRPPPTALDDDVGAAVPREASDMVTIVRGLSPADWDSARSRFLFLDSLTPDEIVGTPLGGLLLAPRHSGLLFVKGIFVADLKDTGLHTGVNLLQADLDRDRHSVTRQSDLEHAVATMWTKALEVRPELLPRFMALLEDGAGTDVRLAAFYSDAALSGAIATQFHATHGALAVPMPWNTTRERIRELEAELSRPVVLCADALFGVLSKGGHTPDVGSLLDTHRRERVVHVPRSTLSPDATRQLEHAVQLLKIHDPGFDEHRIHVVEHAAAPCTVTDVGIIQVAVELLSHDHVATTEAFAAHSSRNQNTAPGAAAGSSMSAASNTNLAPEGSLAPAVAVYGHVASATGAPAWAKDASLARLATTSCGLHRRPFCVHTEAADTVAREAALLSQIRDLEVAAVATAADHDASLDRLRRELRDVEAMATRSTIAEIECARHYKSEYEGRIASLEAAVRAAKSAAAEATVALEADNVQLRSTVAKLQAEAEAAAAAAARRDTSVAAHRARAQRRTKQMLDVLDAMDVSAGPEAGGLADVLQRVKAELLEEESCQPQCVVCFDDPHRVVLMPCRHQAVCVGCARALSRCPLCRARIASIVEPFS